VQWLDIPDCGLRAADRGSTYNNHPVPVRSDEHDSIRVLLVEDDETNSAMLRKALAAARPPIEVAQCRTLTEAIAHLGESSFDAVLLNLDLPDSRGLQTIDRALAEIPGLSIVVMTAAEEPDLGVAAVPHGAQDYLVKSDSDTKYLSRVLRYAVERAGFQAELAHREQHFRALIEHAHDMVVLLAPDGVILYQSPATQRVLGYSPAELIGSNVLELVHPVDRPRAQELLATWPAIQYNDDPVLPFRIRHKNGSWRDLEALGRNLSSDPRDGLIINARDVTERVRAEEELKETEAKLRQVQKMDAIGRLAGGIAHDFNNILTAIYGYADLLLSDLDPGDQRRSDVEEIRLLAQRAANLTRQLLAFSRQQMLQLQVLDLNIVIAAVQNMLERMIGTDVQVLFEPAAGLWPVRADRGQIEQVMMNLAGNARDAMPEGGSLEIRTGNHSLSEPSPDFPGLKPGDYVLLTVTDTGVGMPEDVRTHVFEPFFTTKEQGKGTGLGLATIYGIVKQSGGGIYVASAEKQGTTFSIYLPRHY
jgi:two-component system, cell cycle sensor histidine kinase and response regulator CckA